MVVACADFCFNMIAFQDEMKAKKKKKRNPISRRRYNKWLAKQKEAASIVAIRKQLLRPRFPPQGAGGEDGRGRTEREMGVGEKDSSRRSTRPESGRNLAKPACTYKRPAGTALSVSRKRERESRQRETAVAETAVRNMGSRKIGSRTRETKSVSHRLQQP